MRQWKGWNCWNLSWAWNMILIFTLAILVPGEMFSLISTLKQQEGKFLRDLQRIILVFILIKDWNIIIEVKNIYNNISTGRLFIRTSFCSYYLKSTTNVKGRHQKKYLQIWWKLHYWGGGGQKNYWIFIIYKWWKTFHYFIEPNYD